MAMAALVCLCLPVRGQNSATVDSLLRKLPTAVDSVKIQILDKLCWEFNRSDPQRARDYCKQALWLAKETANADAVGNLYTGLGSIDYYQGNYPRALDYFLQSLKVFEQLNSNEGKARAYNNIAEVQRVQGNHSAALENYLKALSILQNLRSQEGMAFVYNNAGESHRALGDTLKAMGYFYRGLQMAVRQNDQSAMAYSWYNIGHTLGQQGRADSARFYLQQSLALAQRLPDQRTVAYASTALANLCLQTRQLDQALRYARQGLQVSLQTKATPRIVDAYKALEQTYAAMGDYHKAYEMDQRLDRLTDSLYSRESQRRLAELHTSYELSNKQAQIDLLTKEREVRTIVNYSLGIGIVLVLGLAIAFWNLGRLRKQSSDRLQAQNELIEQKNQAITESIEYARRIQEALLPYPERIAAVLPEHCILYRPRDIVSGDFYWFLEKNGLAIIAVADCTGHGVPGAFMSMIGEALLTQIVSDRSILHVDQILAEMHQGIRRALKQDAGKDGSTSALDGMDLGVCVVDLENNETHYAGANIPLVYIQNGKLYEIQPDRHPIGGLQREEARVFTSHLVEVPAPTTFYLFSDGYLDQFGGEGKRKFSYARFKELLLRIHTQPLELQRESLLQAFDQWRGSHRQLDDILVMAWRLDKGRVPDWKRTVEEVQPV